MLKVANNIIKEMENRLINNNSDIKIDKNILKEKLKVGVDLGTRNIVLTVLDRNNNPVIGAMETANVVKDGIVVDYIKAVDIVCKLKSMVEEKLKINLNYAATAIPPGIIEGNVRVIQNIVQGAGFEIINVIDEPEAASKVLKIKNGAVVDIGGGTTGISILQNGKVVFSDDEATGGTHLTLVTSGNFNLSFEEAEKYKLDPKNHDKVFSLVRPVIEKMANITLNCISRFDVNSIYLVGGTCCIDGIENVFEKYTKVKTFKPYNPLLVTPIGISMSIQ